MQAGALYNTETSDYVTLEDIAGFIRDGREVRIVDLKSGDDLTRQYLLQIIAEHEAKGENVLPLERADRSGAQLRDPGAIGGAGFPVCLSFEMLKRGPVDDDGKHDGDEPDGDDAGVRGDAGQSRGFHEGDDRGAWQEVGPARHPEDRR